jgi:hypothetical protein
VLAVCPVLDLVEAPVLDLPLRKLTNLKDSSRDVCRIAGSQAQAFVQASTYINELLKFIMKKESMKQTINYVLFFFYSIQFFLKVLFFFSKDHDLTIEDISLFFS